LAIVFSILMIFVLGVTVGANGIFKGFATTIGSQVVGPAYARILGLLFAVIGGIMSLNLFPEMFLLEWVPNFVPIENVSPAFAMGVCMSATCVLAISTRLGFPASTTVVFLGATMGAGLVSSHMQIGSHLINFKTFSWFAATPFIAWFSSSVLHTIAKMLASFFTFQRQTYLTLDCQVISVVPQGENPLTAMRLLRMKMELNETEAELLSVRESYSGSAFGFPVASIFNNLHVVVAALVSCVWGVLEVQKLLLVSMMVNSNSVFIYGSVGLAGIIIGSVFFGKRVEETLTKEMSELSTGSGLVASFSSLFTVVLSAIVAIPCSLTYAIGGSIMGVGMAGERIKMERSIYVMAAWAVTWPVAMALGGLFYLGLRDLFA
jgi:phosphate/sulfate permease